MKHGDHRARLRIAFVAPCSVRFFDEVHEGLKNFCAQEERLEMIRFQGVSRLNFHALHYVHADGVIGIFPRSSSAANRAPTAIPVINVSNREARPQQVSVLNDDRAVGRMAGEFLATRHDRQLAVIADGEVFHGEERLAAFVQEVEEQGRKCETCFLDYLKVEEGGNYGAFFDHERSQIRRLFHRLRFPAALFCSTDRLAAKVVAEAQAIGVSIPLDLQILGCDNDAHIWAETSVPLSSIELSGKRVGWLAGEALMGLLDGKAVPRVTRVPPHTLVARESTGVPAYSPLVQKIVLVFEERLEEPLCIKTVAQEVGASRRKLEKVFQEETGQSPYAFLTRKRLDRACELLAGTGCSVGEIAEQTGFGNIRALGTHFRRKFGLSPRTWRKIHGENATAAPETDSFQATS